MAYELSPEQPVAPDPGGSPDSASSSSDIDRLLSEILNDPSIFSLLESSPSAPTPSAAPSPPYHSPSPQQLEQDALASLGQQRVRYTYRPSALELEASDSSRLYFMPETPSPTTPSSTTSDHQTFFPLPAPSSSSSSSSSSSLPPGLSRPHPTSLPIHCQTTSLPTHTHQPSPMQDPVQFVLRNVEVAISSTVMDVLLRGQRGKIVSLDGNGLATVLVFSLSQECQVPVVSINWVVPLAGDLVKMIEGALTGVTGHLYSSNGSVSYVTLFDGSIVQVATNHVAKLSPGSAGTPTGAGNSPISPGPVSSTTSNSPLFSPVMPESEHYSSLPPLHSPHHHHHQHHHHHFTNQSYSGSSSGTGYPQNHLSSSLPYLPYQPPPYHSPTTHNSHRARQHGRDGQRYRHLHQQEMMMQRLHGSRSRSFQGGGRGGGASMRNFMMQHFTTRGGVRGDSDGDIIASLSKRQPEQDIKSQLKCLDRPTQEILEEIRARDTIEYDFGSTGDGGELSSNCIQVPLICPLSQRRISLPCRGLQCKHPQCFDADAFIEYNKCVARPKDKKKSSVSQSAKQQLFKCPLCSKLLPFSQLYVDKTLLQILQETEETEVEFDKTGSWKPVEKRSVEDGDVIDLTEEASPS